MVKEMEKAALVSNSPSSSHYVFQQATVLSGPRFLILKGIITAFYLLGG